jgi:hypothetical protein
MTDSTEPQRTTPEVAKNQEYGSTGDLATELRGMTAGHEASVEQSDEVAENSVEQESSPESAERIAKTLSVLSKLAEEAKDHSRPFSRKIVKPVGDGYWHPVESPQNGLRSIDLRTYTGPDSDEAFHLTLSYDEANPTDQLMLSLESPVSTFGNLDVAAAASAGVRPQGRRFQDFLYSQGAEKVPVQEADYTYVFDYRPTGHSTRYEATSEYMDTILGLLKNATVVEQTPRGQSDKKVARLHDLVPEVSEL